MKSTEAQLRARKNYYEKHKEYYKNKSNEGQKKMRLERNIYKKKCEDVLSYVKSNDFIYDANYVKQEKIIEILDK